MAASTPTPKTSAAPHRAILATALITAALTAAVTASSIDTIQFAGLPEGGFNRSSYPVIVAQVIWTDQYGSSLGTTPGFGTHGGWQETVTLSIHNPGCSPYVCDENISLVYEWGIDSQTHQSVSFPLIDSGFPLMVPPGEWESGSVTIQAPNLDFAGDLEVQLQVSI